jgi:CspA family cold shock protein
MDSFSRKVVAGKDVFVHISAVERAGLSSLNEGQTVEYEIESNRGKESAINLKESKPMLAPLCWKRRLDRDALARDESADTSVPCWKITHLDRTKSASSPLRSKTPCARCA